VERFPKLFYRYSPREGKKQADQRKDEKDPFQEISAGVGADY
jgi:hypothetical protein